MSKVHWIGSGNIRGWASTACGIEAMVAAKQYKTSAGREIEAVYRSWDGVTCARCLRNPHSPSGRITASLSSEQRGSEA